VRAAIEDENTIKPYLHHRVAVDNLKNHLLVDTRGEQNPCGSDVDKWATPSKCCVALSDFGGSNPPLPTMVKEMRFKVMFRVEWHAQKACHFAF